MTKQSFPYKEAKLNDCKRDLSKRWYISFYVWSITHNKLIRKRDYYINKFKTEHERQEFAERRIETINELLNEGYFASDSEKTQKADVKVLQKTLIDTLKEILQIKKNSYRLSSYNLYNSTIRKFEEWLIDNKYGALKTHEFDKLKALLFIDYLVSERNLSGSTINNGYVAPLKAIFNEMIEREIIKENPFSKLKKKKVEQSYNNIA